MSSSLVVANEFGQVLRLLRRQRLECDQCNLVLDPKPHRQPVQICCYTVACLGRTKLEPVAIVVLSVIMSLASIQMIRQSVERIVAYAQYDVESASRRNGSMVLCVAIDEMEDFVPSGTDSRPVFELDSIIICVVTVGAYHRCC